MVMEKNSQAWVLTLRIDNKWKPDEWSYLGLGAKESKKHKSNYDRHNLIIKREGIQI